MNSLLLIDIGNTTIDVQICSGKDKRLKLVRGFKDRLRRLLSEEQISEAAIVSVVPRKTAECLDLLREFSLKPWVLDAEKMRFFATSHGYEIDNIDILGGDLFCDLIAREEKDGLIVLDLGTATKILALSPDKVFLGGVLLPGLDHFSLGLTKNAALIPTLGKVKEVPLLSLKTDESIASGIYHGTAILLKGYVEKLWKVPSLQKATVLLTGGNQEKILPFLDKDFRDQVECDSDWCLKGLRLCHEERNRFRNDRSSQKKENHIQ